MLPALLLIAAAHGSLTFVEDDYPKALATARAQHKPLFVDFWATWCHSCLSMQRYVMADPGMKPVADEVVWAAIETETEKNKPIVEQYPLDVWPTFLVIDPDGERIIGRWLGSASVRDLRSFVQDSVAAYRGKGKALDAAQQAQREGDALRNKGDLNGSAEAYGRALAASKRDDPQRPERLALYANALRKSKDARKCVQLGLDEMNNTGDTSIATDFVGYVQSCAEQLPEKDAGAQRLRLASIARVREVLAKKDAPLAADDRSDALATLADLLDASGKHGDAVKAMRERAQLLEKAAAAAPDATLASTFDPHRTDTYLYLKEPARAEALLAQREKEMPGDYNPPARLARVLLEEKKLPEAEAAIDRALAKMPKSQRRVGILGLKAKILSAEGKPAQAALREQLDTLQSLPAAQRNAAQEQKLQDQLKTAAKE